MLGHITAIAQNFQHRPIGTKLDDANGGCEGVDAIPVAAHVDSQQATKNDAYRGFMGYHQHVAILVPGLDFCDDRERASGYLNGSFAIGRRIPGRIGLPAYDNPVRSVAGHSPALDLPMRRN